MKCFRGRFKMSKAYRIHDAWRSNWTGLAQPAYFVVVEVPESVSGWMEHVSTDRSTLEHASAYWTRIDPLPLDQKSIKVQTQDRLTAETFEVWREQFMSYAVQHGLITEEES